MDCIPRPANVAESGSHGLCLVVFKAPWRMVGWCIGKDSWLGSGLRVSVYPYCGSLNE